MNRRGFFQMLGFLPFLNNAKAKENVFCGQVYEAPWPLCHRVVVQWFGRPKVDTWILLSTPFSAAQHKGTAMSLCCYKRKDGSFNPFYTEKELREKLSTWKLLEDRCVLLEDAVEKG